MMHARYRADYPGEFIVLETRWSGGRKTQTREWVDNPIQNQHISHRAACIGTNIDQNTFDYRKLQNHRGGLLGSKKLQTYGTGSIALDMRLDFAVELDPEQIKTLIQNEKHNHGVVYADARSCINNPGLFYLIPHNPRLLTEVLPIYLAAFDGHREIFLLGYNIDSQIGNPLWAQQVANVFAAYNSTKFYVVGIKSNMPQSWFDLLNVESMSYLEFISYCDV